MLGRFASALARHRAVESISVRSLQIETALLVDCDGAGGREIDAPLLQHGDVFKVIPESRIVIDGIVLSGDSEVDESNVTGEAVPVEKSKGSNIIAGSLNSSGTLIVRLTRLPSENGSQSARLQPWLTPQSSRSQNTTACGSCRVVLCASHCHPHVGYLFCLD